MPVWWSSTRPRWPPPPSRWPSSAGRRRPGRRGGRHRPTSVGHRVGRPHRRATRTRPGLAGPAHRRARAWSSRPRACASRRASRPPSSPGCSSRPAPTARDPPSSARSTPGWPGSSARARSTSPMPATPPSPGCTTDGTGWRQDASNSSQSRRPPSPPSWTRRGSWAGHRPAGPPPLCALIGDQQASLMGQGYRSRPGQGHLRHRRHARRLRRGDAARHSRNRGDGGCFPIVAWQRTVSSPGGSRPSCWRPGPRSTGW